MSRARRLPAALATAALLLSWACVRPDADARFRGITESPSQRAADAPTPRALIDLRELSDEAPLVVKRVFDPMLKEYRSYRGYDLESLLAPVLAGHRPQPGTLVIFHCADGYKATLDLYGSTLSSGLLAVRSANDEALWEAPARGSVEIGDFYLLWSDPELPWAKSWPYQVESIEVGELRELLAAALPRGGRRAERGFEIFYQRCISCHSSHLIGGTIGVELSVPVSVTRYWVRPQLKRFIRNPAAFRARSRMPSFEDLTDQDLEDLLRYLDRVGGGSGEDD